MNKTTILALAMIFAGCMQRIDDPNQVMDKAYIHRYGVPVEADNWQAQGSSGQVITTLKSGVIVTTSYSGGVLHGETNYTYPYSDLIEKREHYDTNQLTKETNYYRNGTPSQECTYTGPDSKKIISWYDNGAPQSNEVLENGKLVKGEYFDTTYRPDSRVEGGIGFRTRRDSFGNMVAVDTIDEGAMVTSKTFHPNGAVKDETPYVNNQIHGLVKTYYPDGVPVSIETWNRGQKTGTVRHFENGEMVSEVPYVRGVKEGVEKRYRNGKVVVAEISWANNQKHGPATSYIGETPSTEYFFQGAPVSRASFEKMSLSY